MSTAKPNDGSQPPQQVAEQTTAPVQHELHILSMIKTAQLQNGLRHSDYQRYRLYCHRRIRRIRKKLRFTHGRTRFQKKQIEAKHCSDARFLELVLMSAERAWAQAMELKEEQEQNPRARHHSLARLEKSAKWTRSLATLCEAVGAQRTKLEAQAYSSWMQGNVMRERKQWKEAVDHFVRARTIYQQLGKVGAKEQQDLYNQRAEDIETIITFCQYNLGGKDAAGADIRKVLASAASEDPELQRLKTELDAVLEEARKKSTDVVEEISWQGQSVSVKGQRLRLALVKAKDAQLELAQIDSSKIDRKNEVFDKLFAIYNDAMQAAKEEAAPAAGAASQKTEQQKKSATLLQDYIAYQRLMTTTDRSLMLAEQLEVRFDGLSPEADLTALQDDARQLVGFFESASQASQESEQYLGNDEELSKQADARVFSFKAFRCFYLALQYAADKKAAEALALLERCGEHAEAALAHHNICKIPNKSLMTKVDKLQRDVRGWRCYLQARAFMASTNLASSGEISTHTLAPGGLLSNLDKYDASYLDEKLIVEFPPGFEAIACKPVLFDLALSALEPPDLTEKKKAPKSGFFSSFWG